MRTRKGGPEAAKALCVSVQTIKGCEAEGEGASFKRTIPDRMTKLAAYIERFGDIGDPPYRTR